MLRHFKLGRDFTDGAKCIRRFRLVNAERGH
jgi:hypothetical protein